MPKIVDHDQRRRQIADAVCRITLRRGLGAATFREVAAEAGVSVRLVQHYFGTKRGLLDTTQEHVAERAVARLQRQIEETDGSPRAVLAAFLKSFIPIDEESRVAMLMFVARYTEAMVATLRNDGEKTGRTTEVELMRATILEQLERGRLADTIDPELEAGLLTALTTGLGQYVLDATMSIDEACATIDHHLDRLFVPAGDDEQDAASPLQ